MARGRFVSKEVCIDKKVNELRDPWSMLGFTWLITHADVEGRTYGDPELVKSLIFPRQREISVEDVERYITQWQDAGMIDWYEVEGEKYIQFLNFEKHQVGIRRDKEPLSSIPENPRMPHPVHDQPFEENNPPVTEDLRNNGGTMAEKRRKNGRKIPPEVKEKVEVKVEPEVEVVVPVANAPGGDDNLNDLKIFEQISGLKAPLNQPRVLEQWQKSLTDLRNAGVTDEIMRQACEEMTAKKYRVVGPWSLIRPCDVILAERTRLQAPKRDRGRDRERDSEGKYAAFINK